MPAAPRWETAARGPGNTRAQAPSADGTEKAAAGSPPGSRPRAAPTPRRRCRTAPPLLAGARPGGSCAHIGDRPNGRTIDGSAPLLRPPGPAPQSATDRAAPETDP